MAVPNVPAALAAVQPGPHQERARSMATINLKGKSGNVYEFELYPWDTAFNAVPVVYVVMRKDPDGYAVLYVGETGDLKARIGNHENQPCFDRHRKTHLAVRRESSGERRLSIEADLVAAYNPACNG